MTPYASRRVLASAPPCRTRSGTSQRTRHGPPSRASTRARTGRPSSHAMATLNPPRARQRRQSVKLARAALQQHLRDGSGVAEITVDLEGGMCAEQVGVHSARLGNRDLVRANTAKHVPHRHVRALTLAQPCPQRDLPRQRPARPEIAAQHRRAARRRSQRGCGVRRDLPPRIQPSQMRDVPVPRLDLVPVVRPFLQLATLAQD